jgi:hypothetical protein
MSLYFCFHQARAMDTALASDLMRSSKDGMVKRSAEIGQHIANI